MPNLVTLPGTLTIVRRGSNRKDSTLSLEGGSKVNDSNGTKLELFIDVVGLIGRFWWLL